MESSAKLTDPDFGDLLTRAIPGAGVGVAVVLAVWVAEALVGGRGPWQLHLESVAIWVVDVLPVALGLATSRGRREEVSLTSTIVPPPQLTRPVQPPAPPPVEEDLVPTPVTAPTRTGGSPELPVELGATAPPVPSRLVTADLDAELGQIPLGAGQTVLVVEGSPSGPVLAAWLQARDYRVVHVGEAASGSLAREAERPSLAVVDGDAVGSQALIGELGRHNVPTVVLGGVSATLPRQAVRTFKPPTKRRIGEALRELAIIDEL